MFVFSPGIEGLLGYFCVHTQDLEIHQVSPGVYNLNSMLSVVEQRYMSIYIHIYTSYTCEGQD